VTVELPPVGTPPSPLGYHFAMRFALLLAWVPVTVAVALAPSPSDLARHFQGLNGTFVLLDGTNGEYIRYNPKRAKERFAP
jgi:hypothetical protein